MRNLKVLCLTLGLVTVVSFSSLQAQDNSRKMGFALPICSFESKTNLHAKPCVGFRLDYVGKHKVVLAIENFAADFDHPFFRDYQLYSFLIGYRFDLDAWIKFFGGRSVPVLSSLYITLLPLYPDFFGGEINHFETLRAKEYGLIYRKGPPARIEIGWIIRPGFDVFVYGHRGTTRRLLYKTEDGLKEDRITINALFFGFHLSFF